MKLRLGRTLIETDHIERVIETAGNTVLIHFVSGKEIQVYCSVLAPEMYEASWERTPQSLVEQIQAYERIMPPK